MLFTLEALDAQRGDCLLLHYGSSEAPRFVLIDGGPVGVHKTSLGPRLKALKDAWHPEDALPLQLVMVSHLDDDHIRGVIDLTTDLVERRDDGQSLPYAIQALWHNNFDDLLGSRDDEPFARLAASIQPAARARALRAGLTLSRPGALVVASIAQGRTLRDHAARLGLAVNFPFGDLVMARTTGAKTLSWGNGLRFTVLAPRHDRVVDLHEAWNRELRKQRSAEQAAALAAAYADRSVFNLSSIAVLAELRGKRMLLTGDSRGDDLLAGLSGAGLLKAGSCHVDLLKIPHHGSDRNVETEFFRRVTADHYVISANGEFGNPEVATLNMISEARGKAEFALYLTNREGKNDLARRLGDFFALEKKRGKKYKVVFRERADLSVKVDLLDPVGY